MSNMLTATDVQYIYQSKYQKVHALRGVSCQFESGKFYAIVGHSGSGKTTLLSMLAGLGTPTGGEVRAGEEGRTIKEIGSERHRREDVTVIYQSFNLFPTLSITENVMYPMRINGYNAKEAKQRARELLDAVGLADVDGRKLPAMLSGGQQQRVAIARALASQARVILADEPTGNLDSENGKVVIDLLKKLVKEQGYCVIVVTHDLGIAAQADVVYRMKDGLMDLDTRPAS
ncbi:ABC transporter ATP-binding protein [Acutalibacter caecimuris]|uniref:ABC transporter ATP-binding protein n=1 Tax=Acutalibacter caecimuris TaxID=3093657 RepID=UPI002AC9DA23|nr:ABC transporter ATP-binding protein [Acutalibacter sp. M00118]